MDRGYFSLGNFAKFVDRDSRVVVSAAMDVKWIREAVEKAITSLREARSHIRGDIFGVTVPVKPKFEDGVERELWVHVFRSATKSSTETQAFLQIWRTLKVNEKIGTTTLTSEHVRCSTVGS